jgi:hypothetical protein
MKKIIGDGDIAGVLKLEDVNKDFLFFASGVSNSQEVRESEYQKEKDLLLEQDRKQHIVYFGSLSIFYGNNRYVKHKREMEELVMKEFPRYTIIRLGNISWGTNPHTLINYFKAKIKSGEVVEVRDETRYVVDVEEFLHWINLIPNDFNCEMNVPGKMMKVKEIFKTIEDNLIK